MIKKINKNRRKKMNFEKIKNIKKKQKKTNKLVGILIAEFERIEARKALKRDH